METLHCDVAIIGGGPGGSTTGALLKKYAPELEVAIFERERFPRDHIGESQLPPIGVILDEMGCWDKVEAANFPIKIGVTFRWGQSDKLWDFEILPVPDYKVEPRPRKFGEQTRRLALQVDRSIYDKILLDHAAELGCQVRQQTQVRTVERDGDRVTGLVLDDGTRVEARHYIDASGNAAVLRRAMGVRVDAPTKLQNVAFWDYWENAQWPTRFPADATRILVLSIGAGWIWFIPITRTRTSIGFVCPAEYYKKQGKTPTEIYRWALEQEPLIAELTRNAGCSGKTQATKDWSFLSERMVGENWMLVGEAGGFADPILSAGLTLTHTSAREAAYSIIAMERGEHDADWLKTHYERNQSTRIGQHIRFADFWYSANGIFTDLEEYTRAIADDAGLEFSPKRAFHWFATGGFTNDHLGQAGIGGLDLAGARQMSMRLLNQDAQWQISRYNHFSLNLEGAQNEWVPAYENGRVIKVLTHVRGKRRLVEYGAFGKMIEMLKLEQDIARLMEKIMGAPLAMDKQAYGKGPEQFFLQALEIMVNEGWVTGTLDPKRPVLNVGTPFEGRYIHTNAELNRKIAERGGPA